MCLLGMMCLVLAGLELTAGLAPMAYAGGPGGNVSDPVVRAVDIAKPAVVRIITLIVGQLTVTFSSGKSVTFPLTPQQGFNGYPVELSGTGAFISTHGDILTADHVVHPVQDDKQAIDQYLDQAAAPDVANYINQRSTQKVTADQVTQELIAGQIPSTPTYTKPVSQVFLSTDFSGTISATSFQSLPTSQYATVDQIVTSSPFSQFDTAIIHVNGMNDMPMLQLGDSSAVQEQDQLRIIGFPGAGDVNTTSPNDILTSSVNVINVSSMKTLNGSSLIQVAGNVEQGDSGGPALDSNGQVVGIVSFGSSTTGGGTSFLRASNNAKQMIQQAGIDTTPSAVQKAWNQAFLDYAATVPGHWHQSMREFQQVLNKYPQFKAVSPFLQYASQQAQSETQTQESSTPTATATPTGGPATSVAG
jgi:S1-C subfamily serine protease